MTEKELDEIRQRHTPTAINEIGDPLIEICGACTSDCGLMGTVHWPCDVHLVLEHFQMKGFDATN